MDEFSPGNSEEHGEARIRVLRRIEARRKGVGDEARNSSPSGCPRTVCAFCYLFLVYVCMHSFALFGVVRAPL